MSRLVIIESPYTGDVEANEAYLAACLHDSLTRGEAPFASHGLYTRPGVLDDTAPTERTHGINAGLAWAERADATIVYTDRGIRTGMEYGIAHAKQHHRPIEYRTLKETK